MTYAGSTGTAAAAVKVYAPSVSGAESLAAHIHLKISEGSGGGLGNCTGWTLTGSPLFDGKLSDFNAKLTYANGVERLGSHERGQHGLQDRVLPGLRADDGHRPGTLHHDDVRGETQVGS